MSSEFFSLPEISIDLFSRGENVVVHFLHRITNLLFGAQFQTEWNAINHLTWVAIAAEWWLRSNELMKISSSCFVIIHIIQQLFISAFANAGCWSIACISSAQLFHSNVIVGNSVRAGNIFSVRIALIFRTMQHFRKQHHKKTETIQFWWGEHSRSADVWMSLVKLKHVHPKYDIILYLIE